MFDKCDAFNSTNFDPAMRSATNFVSTGVVAGSCVPAITSVGTRTPPTFSRKSNAFTAWQLAM